MDKLHLRFHLAQREGKVAIGLLVGQCGLDIMETIECEPVAGNKSGIKEGEALDMIPVCMGEDEVQVALATTARAAHELMAQFTQTGTGVYDNGFSARCNLDAGGVASGRTSLERWQLAYISSHSIIILGVKIRRQVGYGLEDFLFNGF
jgi:hypothetical protein